MVYPGGKGAYIIPCLGGENWNNFNSLFTRIPVTVNVNLSHDKIFGSVKAAVRGLCVYLYIHSRAYNGLAAFKLNSTSIAMPLFSSLSFKRLRLVLQTINIYDTPIRVDRKIFGIYDFCKMWLYCSEKSWYGLIMAFDNDKLLEFNVVPRFVCPKRKYAHLSVYYMKLYI